MASRGLIIAAPTSGAGKTTVTLALLRALHDAGHKVAGGKCGPDYIDPTFHHAACGRPSLNFDAWAMSRDTLRQQAADCAAELLLIEGAMGVLDGAGMEGRGSAADTAEALDVPMALVIDAGRSGASAVLPLAGLRALRPSLKLAGVILNNVASPRHGRILSHAFDRLDMPVLAMMPRSAAYDLPQRHLGLVPAGEHAGTERVIAGAASALVKHCDLAAIAAVAGPIRAPAAPAAGLPPIGQRIAVARDRAFAFAYPHLLDGWRAQGAEVLPFSPLSDQAPDASADAVFLPGGYPELHAETLANATVFRAGMEGLRPDTVIYGECGGYMTLGQGLVDASGTRHRMTGLLPLDTSFAQRERTLGYRRLTPLPGALWSRPLNGHEFHYASIIAEPPDHPRLFDAEDADGQALPAMGLRRNLISGSFAHVIAPG